MKTKQAKKYINIWDYKSDEFPFQIFIGGRGTGKTFSALRGAITGECENKFIYGRRTAQELDIMLDGERGEGANPFKKLNEVNGVNYGLRRIVKNLAGVYKREITDDGKFDYLPENLIGYGIALSTIASLRSIDFSDCSDWIYDEFIPEKHVRKMTDEFGAFANAVETINRNREIEGQKALKVWLLANSNDIYNPLFVGLGIVSIVETMIRRRQGDRYIKERGLAIHLINNNEDFVEAKSKTALYRLTSGTQFNDMALKNDFAYNDFSLIGYKNLKGYSPVCSFDKAYIYRKKGSGEYHVSYAPAKCPNFKSSTEQDRRLFMERYGRSLLPRFVQGNITFESYELKTLILDMIL